MVLYSKFAYESQFLEENKPKVWSVQLEKTLNFIINFSVPPSTREKVNYLNGGGGEGRNTLAFASLKLYQELI